MVHGIHGIHGQSPGDRPRTGTALARGDETFRIQGAVFEVYRTMGAGFLEAVYQECLSIEFTRQRIPFKAQAALPLSYKGQALRQTYMPDFICFDSIVFEIKALRELAFEHDAQLLNYLKASGFGVGLLVNFGCAPKARVKRLVL